MSRPLTRMLALGMLTATLPLHAAEDPGIALPRVPQDVVLAPNDTAMPIRHGAAQVSENGASDDGDAAATALSLGPKAIRVSPGTTAIVETAIDHLNRIVTPFASPQVRTVSPATTQVDGSAVYLRAQGRARERKGGAPRPDYQLAERRGFPCHRHRGKAGIIRCMSTVLGSVFR